MVRWMQMKISLCFFLVNVWFGVNGVSASLLIEEYSDHEIQEILGLNRGQSLSSVVEEPEDNRDASPERPKPIPQRTKHVPHYQRKETVRSRIHFHPCFESKTWGEISSHLLRKLRPKGKELPILYIDLDDTVFTLHPIKRFCDNMDAMEAWDRGNNGSDAFIDGFFSALQAKLPHGIIFAKEDLDAFSYYYDSFFQETWENPEALCTTGERFYLHQLMDKDIPNYLESLSKRGWLICGLTSRQSQSALYSNAQLKSLGIDLKKLNATHPLSLMHDAFLSDHLLYSNYIFFTNCLNKNGMMGIIMNYLSTHYPKCSQFITAHVDDNYADQLSVMPKSFNVDQSSIVFKSFRPLKVTHYPIYYTKDDQTIAQDHRNAIMALVDCPKFIAAIEEFYKECTSKPDITFLSCEVIEDF